MKRYTIEVFDDGKAWVIVKGPAGVVRVDASAWDIDSLFVRGIEELAERAAARLLRIPDPPGPYFQRRVSSVPGGGT